MEDYGLLAGQPLDSLRAGARVELGEGKRSPLDFVLWKKARPGEPTWPSPWGEGRPGWHTECVVMSLGLLGDGFDLHMGGLDLKFPHHENERAQAVALDHRFSRHWMHHAFVETGGEKMSKSLDNFVSLTDLLERTDPRALRLLVLQSHYRSPMEVTPDTVAQAEHALAGLDAFARRLGELPAGTADEIVLERFHNHMDDDLDTPAAMALLFDSVRRHRARGGGRARASDRGDRCRPGDGRPRPPPRRSPQGPRLRRRRPHSRRAHRPGMGGGGHARWDQGATGLRSRDGDGCRC